MKLLKSSNSGSGGSSTPVLKELNCSIVVPGSSSKTMSLTAFNQFDLRTLYAKSSGNDKISVAVIDGLTTQNIVYQSNLDTTIYDIINIPVSDKDKAQQIHFIVTNTGIYDNLVTIKIQVTSLT
jgi:hypothetical protein